MAIRQNREGLWEVDAHFSKALPGFNRIRRKVASEAEAKKLHDEIVGAIEVYGKWPVGPLDEPRAVTTKRKSKTGTLREGANLALRYHWHGTEYGKTVETIIWQVIEWMEDHGCADIDKITSHHLDLFINHRRSLGNSNETINKYLSIFSVINKIGLERRPPLCTNTLPIKRLKGTIKEKWWLRPEQLDDLTKWLDSRGDEMFADYIRFVCYQGLRAEETLRLEPRHIVGIGSDQPTVIVPGTKTVGSEAAIPLFDLARPTVEACLARAKRNGWRRLFPITLRKAQSRWNECRVYLGAEDIPTATLKALRRTFAAFANARGMPTGILKDVMRHSTITTTEGYLKLVGAGTMNSARHFMADGNKAEPEVQPKGGGLDHASAISLYKSTGATPEEVARFIKELMT